MLDRVEFYAQDLRILRELGHEVVVATRAAELTKADLYFCWWWTWAFIPLTIALLRRRPCVITGVFDEWKLALRPRYERWLLKWALRASSANVFISDLEARSVPARFRTTRPSYSPCVVDTEVYKPRNLGQRESFVLTVAWLHKENAKRKGILQIIQAAALIRDRLPHVRFVIAGERGSGYPELLRAATEHNVTDIVTFPGAISRDEKIALMRRCGAYLQPSEFEGFGLAVLEAMSCGAPVVASGAGALPEVVGNTGVILSDTSPETIADAVSQLLAEPERSEHLGRLARQRAVALFSVDKRLADMKAVIDSLLTTKSSAFGLPSREI